MNARFHNPHGPALDPQPNMPTDAEIARAYELRREVELRLLEPTERVPDVFGAQHYHWARAYKA